MKTRIKVIGLPCNTRSLPSELLDVINSSDVIAGGKANLDLFPEARGKRVVLAKSLDSFLNDIELAHNSEKSIVVLTTGDPMIFGPVKNLLTRFSLEELEIHNTVSPLQVALARIGEDIEDSVIISFHGRNRGGELDPFYLLEKVFFFTKSIIYTDYKHNPGYISEIVLKLDQRTASWRVVVCEKLGQKEERIMDTVLENVAGEKFNSPNILVIFNPEPLVLKRPGNFGNPDSSYRHRKGMITHPEVRAVSLSKLKLSNSRVIWDVGAGSGSLGIEAHKLYGVTTYLIEKNEDRFSDLLTNCSVLESKNLVPIKGDILEVEDHLPDPDRVFIGGGGKKLVDIFRLCFQRLKPGGIIVCNVITIDSINALYSHLKDSGFSFGMCRVGISRAQPIKNQFYMKSENSITIFDVKKGHGNHE